MFYFSTMCVVLILSFVCCAQHFHKVTFIVIRNEFTPCVLLTCYGLRQSGVILAHIMKLCVDL